MSLYDKFEGLILWMLSSFVAGGVAVATWAVRYVRGNRDLIEELRKQTEELKRDNAVRAAQRELELQTVTRIATGLDEVRITVQRLEINLAKLKGHSE